MSLEIPYHLENFIGGNLIGPLSGNFIDNVNPATGEVYGQVPDSNEKDVNAAVAAAAKAFPLWSTTPVTERFKILNQVAELIDSQLDELALAETNDSGKPFWLSRNIDIPRASANFRFFASGIMHFASESHSMEDKAVNYTLRQPLGIVACISPWNLPLYLFTWKIAPALAAGNCVIAKPSEVTPVTAFMLGELAREINFPAGVLNIVQGRGPDVGPTLVTHPLVKAISFTGSTAVGASIAAQAGPALKKTSLELGGKNATVVFKDAPR